MLTERLRRSWIARKKWARMDGRARAAVLWRSTMDIAKLGRRLAAVCSNGSLFLNPVPLPREH